MTDPLLNQLLNKVEDELTEFKEARVHKGLELSSPQVKYLKQRKLIKDRKSNYYISKQVAQITDETVSYQKRKGLDDAYCREMILRLLEMGAANRQQIEELLLDKLSNALTTEQKKVRVKNILQLLRRKGYIEVGEGKSWRITTQGINALQPRT